MKILTLSAVILCSVGALTLPACSVQRDIFSGPPSTAITDDGAVIVFSEIKSELKPYILVGHRGSETVCSALHPIEFVETSGRLTASPLAKAQHCSKDIPCILNEEVRERLSEITFPKGTVFLSDETENPLLTGVSDIAKNRLKTLGDSLVVHDISNVDKTGSRMIMMSRRSGSGDYLSTRYSLMDSITGDMQEIEVLSCENVGIFCLGPVRFWKHDPEYLLINVTSVMRDMTSDVAFTVLDINSQSFSTKTMSYKFKNYACR